MPERAILLTGGPIHTMVEGARAPAEAIAWRGRELVAVGALDEVRAAAPDAEIRSLEGRAVTPGFVDPHHHLSICLLFELGVDVSPEATPTLAALVEAVRREGEKLPPGAWVVGIGYDEWRMPERTSPTRAILDEACPDRPVYLMQYSGHEACVNSRALEVLGIRRDTPDPFGGVIERDRRGRPTGRLVEAAAPLAEGPARAAMIARHADDFAAHLPDYERRLFRVGVVRIGDPVVPPDLLSLYRLARARDKLSIPCVVGPMAPGSCIAAPDDWLDHGTTGEGDETLRIGPAKFALDGAERCYMCLSIAQAAGMAARALAIAARRRSLLPLATLTRSTPKLSGATLVNGVAFYDDARRRALASAAIDRGMSLAVHAIGATALEQAVDMIARVRTRHRDVPPPRIEHALFSTRELRRRMADLGVVAVMQPDFLRFASEGAVPPIPSGMRYLALRSMLDDGVRVAASSDFPAGRFDPLVGLREALSRRTREGETVHADEAVSAAEVLAMYTREAARALGCLDATGTLERGKRADLVVLSHDPCASGADVESLRVVETVLGGESVFRA